MTDETPAPTNRIAASLIAAIPFVALQLAFLCDPYGLSMVMFGYGAIVVFAIGVFVAWLVYLGIELWWRAKRHCTRGMPVFAGVGGVFLLLFFAPSMFLRPALLEIPTFCRATQAINWKTSTGEFILVLSGTGTTNNYRFTNGYMNWIGEGRELDFRRFMLIRLNFNTTITNPIILAHFPCCVGVWLPLNCRMRN